MTQTIPLAQFDGHLAEIIAKLAPGDEIVLTRNDRPVATLRANPQSVIDIAVARYVSPTQLYLRFADGLEGTWTFEQLDLDMANMKLDTVRASDAGTHVEVQDDWGEDVQLDSSSLRYLVDPKYAADVESRLNVLAARIGL
jgi:antitoxin (DNA-binding transcriptional repressor) of toxin-antitoxin stability system